MNIIYYRNIIAKNGWKWRLELFTASDTPLPDPPTYYELPETFVHDEIVWGCSYAENLPLGLPNTPTLDITVSVHDEVCDTAEMRHLRERLANPFVEYAFPPSEITYPPEWRWDEASESWVQQSVPPTTKSPTVDRVYLTNIVRLATNFGDNGKTFDDIVCNDANSNTGIVVFTGAQRISPRPEFDYGQQTLSVAFYHLTRFVLEQLNPTIVCNVIDENEGDFAPIRTAAIVVYTGFRNNPGEQIVLGYAPTGYNVEMGSPPPTSFSEAPNPQNIHCISIDALFTAIERGFVKIRNKCLRRTDTNPAAWGMMARGYVSNCQFYAQNTVTGEQVTGPLGEVPFNLLFVVYKAFAQEDDNTVVGGLFASNSRFQKYKNMFDFMVDVYEGACIANYNDVAIWQQRLQIPTAFTLPEITDDQLANYKLHVAETVLSAANVRADDSIQTVGGYNATLAEKAFNADCYFHNLPPSAFKIDYTRTHGTAQPQYALTNDFQEGRLLFPRGATSEMIAVHPAMGYRHNNGMDTETFATSAQMWSPSIYTKAWDDIESIVQARYESWRSNFGIRQRVGAAIYRWFSSYNQCSVKSAWVLGKDEHFRNGLTVILPPSTIVVLPTCEPLPTNVGQFYPFDNTVFPTWLQVPNYAVLTGSTVNVTDGTCEVEFFIIQAPSA